MNYLQYLLQIQKRRICPWYVQSINQINTKNDQTINNDDTNNETKIDNNDNNNQW